MLEYNKILQLVYFLVPEEKGFTDIAHRNLPDLLVNASFKTFLEQLEMACISSFFVGQFLNSEFLLP